MPSSTNTSNEHPGESELPGLQVKEVELLKLPDGTKIEDIQQVGDYTIALIQGNNVIQVYDKHGRRVEDFDNIGERFVAAPATFVYKEKEKVFVCMDGGTDSGTDIQKKDFLARPGMGKYSRILKQKLKCSFVTFSELAFGSNSKKITLSPDGRYVCLFDSKQAFVLYDTQDDKGNQQPARNWKRYDNVDEVLPNDIVQFLNRLEADTSVTNRIKINERLYAKITDGGITSKKAPVF